MSDDWGPNAQAGWDEVSKLRTQIREIKEAAEAYEKDPVNAFDKPSSWGKLSTLVKLAKKG
jgi:hypothetical protein